MRGMLLAMTEVDARIARVRDAFDVLLARSRERLLAGAAVERIHRHYLAAAFEILEDAEARAVLASAGDVTALESLNEDAAKLEELHAALIAEFPL